MSIRTHLILSYLALVVAVTFGMWFVADNLLYVLSQSDMQAAEEGVQNITQANYELSREVLTSVGEYIVTAKAEGMAQSLAQLLGGKPRYDYARMRRDRALRDLATQEITTPLGKVGYMDLIDKTGVAVLHPNPEVEGKNFSHWRDEFPDMWRLVSQSFTQPRVQGYYTFLDREQKPRKKFMVLVQVAGTPFVLVAAVNIDQFFAPVHKVIRQNCDAMMTKAKTSVQEVSDSIDLKSKLVGVGAGVAFSMLGGLAGLMLAGRISGPLMHLRDAVQQVGGGNFAVAVPETGAREVVQLAHAFNQLGEQLQDYMQKRDFIRDTFGRYVTQEVVKRLLEDDAALQLGGEIREVTILMSDLRGFTALTAGMQPQQVITFLNRYLGKMIEILLDHEAVIDEIIGDGILAFFGAPTPMPQHPARAVACALKMQAAMEEINALNAQDGLPHLEMGVGINTGEVVVGNIGSERRTKYSVVGAHVNYASRIESYALGGQVLVGAATEKTLPDLLEVGNVIQAQMKGVPGVATIYEVRGLGAPYNLRLKEKSDALITLAQPLPVQVLRLKDKIVVGAADQAEITDLSETSAHIRSQAELVEWEDVRLDLLDEHGAPQPGKIYAKVISLSGWTDEGMLAELRFTSVSPESSQLIRAAMGLED
jgi:class 3 adenylate cyclase/HAMP domain-containing protein